MPLVPGCAGEEDAAVDSRAPERGMRPAGGWNPRDPGRLWARGRRTEQHAGQLHLDTRERRLPTCQHHKAECAPTYFSVEHFSINFIPETLDLRATISTFTGVLSCDQQ